MSRRQGKSVTANVAVNDKSAKPFETSIDPCHIGEIAKPFLTRCFIHRENAAGAYFEKIYSIKLVYKRNIDESPSEAQLQLAIIY